MQGPLQHTVRKWSDLVRDVDKTYSLFENLGVSTLASSRIASYRRLHHAFAAAGHNPAGIGLQNATRLLHAALEVDQLILIAAAASERPTVWKGRLEPLIAGAAFPLEEKRAAQARDMQYECFIAAAAQLGGYDVLFDEPDLVISAPDLVFGCAAKRPRHSGTFLKNCRGAVRQIRRVGKHGIVALDVSAALFSDFCINTDDPIGVKEVAARSLWNFVEKHATSIRAECGSENVIGVLVTAYVPALVYGESLPQIYTSKVWSAVDIAQAGTHYRQVFANFVERAHTACFRANLTGA